MHADTHMARRERPPPRALAWYEGAEEIGCETITLPKIQTSFHGSLVTLEKNSRRFPKFHASFHGSQREFLSLKRIDTRTGKLSNLEMQT